MNESPLKQGLRIAYQNVTGSHHSYEMGINKKKKFSPRLPVKNFISNLIARKKEVNIYSVQL